MFGTTFYHDTLRKYVILFGTLFNDIWINREDNAGNVKQSFKIPLSYGPREKFLARIEGLSDGNDPMEQEVAMVLPRMGFEITGFNYASERKLPSIRKFSTAIVDNDISKYQYNPVPYDINFALSIYVKNTTDGTRIIEQILPYFTPDFTTTVNLQSDPDITLDIPLIISDIAQDDIYEDSFETRRTLIWTLNFVMKGFFFGPAKKQEVIKLANAQFFDSTTFTDIEDSIGNIDDPLETVAVQPGLLTGDLPTVYTELNAVQATAIATIDGGSVTSITLIEKGYGYSTATVTISDPVSGTTATAVAVVDSVGDIIGEITVTNGGSGYLSTPTVTISAPDLQSLSSDQISSDSNYGVATTIQN